MRAILEAGLRIPANLALIGCGNLHFANYLRMPLSSVDQQSAAIGMRAAGDRTAALGPGHTPKDTSA
jgi:LacI family transcriptional regulator